MKTYQAVKATIVGLFLVGAAIVCANGPASATASAPKSETPATLAYASDRPVDVDTAPAEQTIEVQPIAIVVARHSAPAFRPVQGCSFDFRNVTQGPEGGKVRGFCN